jgi:hypothetical protein
MMRHAVSLCGVEIVELAPAPSECEDSGTRGLRCLSRLENSQNIYVVPITARRECAQSGKHYIHLPCREATSSHTLNRPA